jgi:hypothetical protein
MQHGCSLKAKGSGIFPYQRLSSSLNIGGQLSACFGGERVPVIRIARQRCDVSDKLPLIWPCRHRARSGSSIPAPTSAILAASPAQGRAIVAISAAGSSCPPFARGRASPAERVKLTSLFDKAQRRIASLRLWWRRREDDAGFEQKLPRHLPYDIAHLGGGDVPREQLDGMRLRPFALLVGALAA